MDLPVVTLWPIFVQVSDPYSETLFGRDDASGCPPGYPWDTPVGPPPWAPGAKPGLRPPGHSGVTPRGPPRVRPLGSPRGTPQGNPGYPRKRPAAAPPAPVRPMTAKAGKAAPTARRAAPAHPTVPEALLGLLVKLQDDHPVNKMICIDFQRFP